MKKLIRAFNTEFEQNGADLVIIDTAQRGARPIMVDSHVLDEAIKNGDNDALNMISMDVNNQELIVTPSTEKQTFLPDTNYTGFSPVVVEAVEPIKEPYKPRAINFANYTGTELDYELENLDLSEITTMYQFFYKNSNLVSANLKNKNLSNVTNVEQMYYYCSKLLEIDLNGTNLGAVTSLKEFARGCTSLKKLNLEGCDLSKVTNLSLHAWGSETLEEYKLDESIKQAPITNANGAFGHLKITELDLSNWDFSRVKDFSSMFSSAKIDKLNLSGVITSEATNMGEMFFSASVEEIDFTDCDTSNVTDFHQCFTNAKDNLDISMFDFGKATNVNSMFNNAYSLKNLTFGYNLGKGYTQKSSNYSPYALGCVYAYNITRESALDIFNKVYDLNLTYDVANGGTLYTQSLKFSSDVIKRLTPEDILIATNKGWTVA